VKLAGSCECRKVKFTVESQTPVPFMYCFCSICRKTSGAAFGCNIMGLRLTLRVTGKAHLALHRARIRRAGQPPERSLGERYFCGRCGTHLYLLDRRWPEHVWPNVAAIDSDLPAAPEHVYMMTSHKPGWLPAHILQQGKQYPEYPPLSIQSWHEQHGLLANPARAEPAAATSDKPRPGSRRRPPGRPRARSASRGP
jgi:hypothetical protein